MLIKAREIPLLFAALTIALLIFAVVWTGPWPQLCPQQQQQSANGNQSNTASGPTTRTASNPSTDNAQSRCDEHAITDWWTVRIGLLTILVLGGQLIMFWRQLNAMQTGVKDAAIAANAALVNANAALSSAETARDAERAYIRMSHVTPDEKDARPALTFDADDIPVARMQIKNWGRTPARVLIMGLESVVHDKGTDLPVPPYFSAEAAPLQIFLVPDGSFYFGTGFTNPVDVSAIKSGEKILNIIGYVEYVDKFDRRHRSTYGRKFSRKPKSSGNNLSYILEPGYNDDIAVPTA